MIPFIAQHRDTHMKIRVHGMTSERDVDDTTIIWFMITEMGLGRIRLMSGTTLEQYDFVAYDPQWRMEE